MRVEERGGKIEGQLEGKTLKYGKGVEGQRKGESGSG